MGLGTNQFFSERKAEVNNLQDKVLANEKGEIMIKMWFK